jgi:hypothetical protein
MASSFLRGDRDQSFLLPLTCATGLPDGHLAWFILEVVDQLDLAPFYLAHRDGKPTASRSDGLRAAMTAKLASDDGKACYAKRKQTIEPVFGQLKGQQAARWFLRRGLAACQAEWKLLCGTHNLLKLWRHRTTTPSASPATT